MPVYNTEPAYLKSCLESIERQTFKYYETIVVDNESDNPETIEILNKYKNDGKINLYTCKRKAGRRNISRALNYGLKKCKHEFVARMDSDDIMVDDRLQKQLAYMISNPEVDICGGQITGQIKTRHKEFIDQDEYKKVNWFMNHPTIMYKKTKILELGGYDETPEFCPEDFLLWARALKNNLILRNMQEILIYYRIHNENLNSKDRKHPDWHKAMEDCRK